LGYFEKCAQCNRLFDLSPEDEDGKYSAFDFGNTKAAFAWDIVELKTIGFSWRFGAPPPPFFAGNYPCDRTVTFMNGCYYASAVNFAMWGKVNRLCHDALNPYGFGLTYWTLDFALDAAAWWKGQSTGNWGEEEQEALLFTRYGYTGRLGWPFTPRLGCSPNNQSWTGPFHWFWKPNFYPPR
jgi:hypothetical protein